MACLALSRAWQAPIALQSGLRQDFCSRQRIAVVYTSSSCGKRSVVRCQQCVSNGGLEERGESSGRASSLHLVVAAFSSLRSRLQVLCEEVEEEWDGAALLKQQGGSLSLGMALLSTSIIARDRISPVLLALRANPTFMSGLVAWAVAQVLKVFTKYWVERKWDWKVLVGSGGMPSSHSALCVGLTTAVALCHGVGDSLFPVCLGFTLIVMYDAAGVRRHAGYMAEVLNMIVEDLFQGHPVSEKKLKELLGHTPLQVGAGAILGMICGYICSRASMIY